MLVGKKKEEKKQEVCNTQKYVTIKLKAQSGHDFFDAAQKRR